MVGWSALAKQIGVIPSEDTPAGPRAAVEPVLSAAKERRGLPLRVRVESLP